MRILLEPTSGYSTQAQVSVEVAEIINNSRLRFWFASDFNPLDNDMRSNPLCIYDALDRAAKRQEASSPKAADIAAKLRRWVHEWRAQGLIDQETQARALLVIKIAPDDGGFEPVVFYLAGLTGVIREDQPDEYRVENYPIYEATVRQILPVAFAVHGRP